MNYASKDISFSTKVQLVCFLTFLFELKTFKKYVVVSCNY